MVVPSPPVVTCSVTWPPKAADPLGAKPLGTATYSAAEAPPATTCSVVLTSTRVAYSVTSFPCDITGDIADSSSMTTYAVVIPCPGTNCPAAPLRGVYLVRNCTKAAAADASACLIRRLFGAGGIPSSSTGGEGGGWVWGGADPNRIGPGISGRRTTSPQSYWAADGGFPPENEEVGSCSPATQSSVSVGRDACTTRCAEVGLSRGGSSTTRSPGPGKGVRRGAWNAHTTSMRWSTSVMTRDVPVTRCRSV